MLAVMIAPVVLSSALAVWLIPGLMVALMLVATVTTPEFRRLSCGLAVAVVIAGGLVGVHRMIVMVCPSWWILCGG